MCTNCPEEDATIPLYMLDTIVCAENLSPTQKQLEDFPRIVLTSPHDWDTPSVWFPKVSHSKEEEDLFSGITAIRFDVLRSKVHDTDIDTGLRDTAHNPSFILTRQVSQVRISDAKVPDATIITDIDEGYFWRSTPRCTLT